MASRNRSIRLSLDGAAEATAAISACLAHARKLRAQGRR